MLPNKWVTAYGLLFIPFAWLADLSFSQLGMHVVVAIAAFVILLVLFIVGGMGGGDVKLGAVVFLWAGVPLGFAVLVIVALSGGVIGMLGWLADRKILQSITWQPVRVVCHGLSAKRGVPYGMALALGGMFVLGQYLRLWLN